MYLCRMKIYQNNKYIKNVPKKFEPIKDLIPNIVSKEKKFLTTNERSMLNKELLNHYFLWFMHRLRKTDPIAFDHLRAKGDKIKALRRITRKDDSVEFRVTYENGVEAFCKRSDFPNVIYEEGYAY